MDFFFSYEILQITWWLILGGLLAAFAVTDGFDLGINILSPFVAKNDIERRILLNSIGPVWEGNQVWLVLGAGTVFSAWPIVYAVVFSVLYLPFLIILVGLILRPVGFDYRGKIDNVMWKKMWDTCIFISGFVPSFMFGVTLGNIVLGIDFSFDTFMTIKEGGSFFRLFSIFPILCGLLVVSMLATHGASYLRLKTEGNINNRARFALSLLPLFTIAVFGIIILLLQNIDGYSILSRKIGTAGMMEKTVKTLNGEWFNNYRILPILILLPLSVMICTSISWIAGRLNKPRITFLASAASIISLLGSLGATMFPFIIPSRISSADSLTVWDASSSRYTLLIMLISVIVLLPIIISYTSYVYYIIRGKIGEDEINAGGKSLY